METKSSLWVESYTRADGRRVEHASSIQFNEHYKFMDFEVGLDEADGSILSPGLEVGFSLWYRWTNRWSSDQRARISITGQFTGEWQREKKPNDTPMDALTNHPLFELQVARFGDPERRHLGRAALPNLYETTSPQLEDVEPISVAHALKVDPEVEIKRASFGRIFAQSLYYIAP